MQLGMHIDEDGAMDRWCSLSDGVPEIRLYSVCIQMSHRISSGRRWRLCSPMYVEIAFFLEAFIRESYLRPLIRSNHPEVIIKKGGSTYLPAKRITFLLLATQCLINIQVL